MHLKMAVANSIPSLKCEVCTATATPYSKFCTSCGAKLDEETQALKYYLHPRWISRYHNPGPCAFILILSGREFFEFGVRFLKSERVFRIRSSVSVYLFAIRSTRERTNEKNLTI